MVEILPLEFYIPMGSHQQSGVVEECLGSEQPRGSGWRAQRNWSFKKCTGQTVYMNEPLARRFAFSV